MCSNGWIWMPCNVVKGRLNPSYAQILLLTHGFYRGQIEQLFLKSNN